MSVVVVTLLILPTNPQDLILCNNGMEELAVQRRHMWPTTQ